MDRNTAALALKFFLEGKSTVPKPCIFCSLIDGKGKFQGIIGKGKAGETKVFGFWTCRSCFQLSGKKFWKRVDARLLALEEERSDIIYAFKIEPGMKIPYDELVWDGKIKID